MENEKTSSVNQEEETTLSDTRLSKVSQVPHRFFLYSTFQTLIESSLQQQACETPEEANHPLQKLLQGSLDDALKKVVHELNESELFIVAEA